MENLGIGPFSERMLERILGSEPTPPVPPAMVRGVSWLGNRKGGAISTAITTHWHQVGTATWHMASGTYTFPILLNGDMEATELVTELAPDPLAPGWKVTMGYPFQSPLLVSPGDALSITSMGDGSSPTFRVDPF